MEQNDECLTPPEIFAEPKYTITTLIPEKSRRKYQGTYRNFLLWREQKKTTSFSEEVFLAYFNELSRSLKPSSLWSRYSMLRSELSANGNVDISAYKRLSAFLKRKSTGFHSKKSKLFTSKNIEEFLTTAPDAKFLATKVASIFGICGGTRSQELTNILLTDIEIQGKMLLIKITNTNTGTNRSFTIDEKFVNIVNKYWALRPPSTKTARFFINYQHEKCTTQPIGINKFAKMPRQIAEYLKLNDPELYNGHSFRRTTATFLANSGADILALKRHGDWNSNSVAEDYCAESVTNEISLPSTSGAALIFRNVSNKTIQIPDKKILIKMTNCSNCSFHFNK